MKMVLSRLGRFELVTDHGTNTVPAPGFIKTTVLACAICRTDAKMWEQGHRDLVLPRVLGHEMVVQDKDGNRFIVWPGKSCEICRHCRTGNENLCEKMEITGFHTDGGFADTAVLPGKSLIPIPESLDSHIACFAEPVSCIINAFEKMAWNPGDRLLILGAGTMGLITALYAKHLKLNPVLIEKNQDKIERITPFINAAKVSCIKDTVESEFDLVINTCADYIAFCQGITKAGKGSQISFFSGITKNEHIETNLLNLIHYKEATVKGVYGMTRAHMRKAVPFLSSHAPFLSLLIEKTIPPARAIDLMPEVLSGKHLKYILDFSIDHDLHVNISPGTQKAPKQKPVSPSLKGLCKEVIDDIVPVPDTLLSRATAKMDEKTKPLGALGRLESLAIRMSCIQDRLTPKIRNKHLFVFAADHGITEEGVSAYPSEVTAQMVDNFLNGGAAINVLCRHNSIGMHIVDMGVNHEFRPHEKLICKKVANGTDNFAVTDAMTRDQMVEALENGMNVFLDTYNTQPMEIVGLGEMGIGNTTSAAAIISVITGITPAQAAGRGTGVDDKGLAHKIDVIERVLAFHRIDPSSGLQVLQKIGGYEIAGMTGAILAAATKKCAAVLDGVISTAAGLIACQINPAVQGYLISGHRSVEKSQKAALDFMGLEPVVDFDMRLGEGTGAAIAIDVVEAACKIMCEMASFDEARVARSHDHTRDPV